ncbi:MAG: hypothetical protein PVH23_06910, partial [candidate division WOR-3 bacterium]
FMKMAVTTNKKQRMRGYGVRHNFIPRFGVGQHSEFCNVISPPTVCACMKDYIVQITCCQL